MQQRNPQSCCCSPPVLPLLESRHLGFVHIPKNAGTSVEHALGLPRSCHATAAECSQCAPRESRRAFTFATVREPLLVLELRTRAAGAAADAPADAAETVELSRDDLARALETLKEGADALHAARKK